MFRLSSDCSRIQDAFVKPEERSKIIIFKKRLQTGLQIYGFNEIHCFPYNCPTSMNTSGHIILCGEEVLDIYAMM